MILIDALFINKGGGAVLLRYLIQKIRQHPDQDKFFFLLDPRFEGYDLPKERFTVIPNKLSERKKFYKQHRNSYSTVFSFANTPPPVKLKVPAYTYLHNQKLLEAPKMKFKKNYFSQYIKYLFIRLYNRNTNYYIVQTPHMVSLLTGLGLKDKAHCLTIPFYDSERYAGTHPPFADRVNDEFVYIANPSPQKNYPTLLDAWEYLLAQGHKPILHVTIDDTAPQLSERVHALNIRGTRIINHVYLDPRELYTSRPYLIFPSFMESFGLPLIEAVECGMKLITSELPYVYDVVKPSLTFDTNDKTAIANAVLTAINTELPPSEILTKNEVDKLINLLLKAK